ncbi:caspase-10-like isoform X2 [Macrobrachium rosenbergii]|uniref:caspase-10-like isoform X2 n=1 Tax=Macrobrachium rosenbergii TaxID=79674 RepID=UPI0034D6A7B2
MTQYTKCKCSSSESVLPGCKLDVSAKNAEGKTALALAATNLHWDIALAILESLQNSDADLLGEVLLLAAKSKQWEMFEKFNDKEFRITPKTWLSIATTVATERDWKNLCVVFEHSRSVFVEKETLLRNVLNSEWDGLSHLLSNYKFENQVMCNLLRDVVKEKCWEGAKRLLENYKYCQQTVLYNLAEASKSKQWQGVEVFLGFVSKNARIDLEFLEKIPQYSEKQLKEFIYAKNYGYEVMNGVLLACACSVEENVINMLFNVFHVLEKNTLDNLLFMGVLQNNLKILSPLLHCNLNNLTYDTLVSARNLAKRLQYKDVVKILSVAIDEQAKMLLSSSSVSFEGRGMGQGIGLSLQPATQQIQSGPLQLFVRRSPNDAPLYDPHCEVNNEDTYKITSTPRGLVLILNYQRFQNRRELLREGSQFDVINLMNIFSQMGYEPQVYWDLTEDQTISTLDSFRNQRRLKDVDCAIVFVMSHGVARQTFHTSDMQCVTVDKVQSMFLDSECPFLVGKPKLFFYNFCRGIDEPQLTPQSDAVRETPRDMMNVFSTPEGFRSYRYAEAGTPFVMALCRVLSENACDDDLDDLLRKFKKAYSTSNHGTTPDIQDLNFAKKFYFNPRQ